MSLKWVGNLGFISYRGEVIIEILREVLLGCRDVRVVSWGWNFGEYYWVYSWEVVLERRGLEEVFIIKLKE